MNIGSFTPPGNRTGSYFNKLRVKELPNNGSLHIRNPKSKCDGSIIMFYITFTSKIIYIKKLYYYKTAYTGVGEACRPTQDARVRCVAAACSCALAVRPAVVNAKTHKEVTIKFRSCLRVIVMQTSKSLKKLFQL